MRTIYSLEDDADISKIIHVSLEKAGYSILSFDTTKTFFEIFDQKKPDMVLLDLMLPDGSGMDVLKKIRSDKDNAGIKIIIISAKRMTMDKVEGLDSGADDYIEKPFDILELISRVNARFRDDRERYSYGPLLMDVSQHNVSLNDKSVILTNTEFEILKLLMQNQKKVVTREDVFKKIYQSDSEFESRTIDMHVASLRKKLNDKETHLIRTIYGVGYIIG